MQKSLKISQAKNRVAIQKIFAALIMAISLLFTICSTLKSIYFSTQGITGPFSSIFLTIQNSIYTIYAHTQFILNIWKYAPVIHLQTLIAYENLIFLLILVSGGIGRAIWDSASHLSKRIANTILKVEELKWEQELMGKGRSQKNFKADALQININLHEEEQWHKRPLGMFLIGTATIIIGQLLNLKFGFIKL
ncbi:MAG: YniB family protein [Janthinobacterium sp.]